MFGFLVFTLLTISTSFAHIPPFDEDLIVETKQGPVKGYFNPLTAGNALTWFGIPYAKPPSRFQPPQPPIHRGTTLLKAKYFGPPCLQKVDNVTGDINTTASSLLIGSEDCLYLNIWVPGTKRTRHFKRTSTDKLPVIIAFHDGRQAVGSGNDTSILGHIFTGHHKKAIWVTFNYRLGPWGFLAHSSLTSEQEFSGAYGALDQIAAVRWVQENIERFGGDKKRVMLYGVGGGAVGISTLLASINSHGLYHSVLMESPYTLWQKPLSVMEDYYDYLISTGLNCTGYSGVLDCIRNVTNEELCEAFFIVNSSYVPPSTTNTPWNPALFWLHHYVVPIGGFLSDSIPNILKLNPPNKDITVLIGGSANESDWYKLRDPSITFTVAMAEYFTKYWIKCKFPFESQNSTALMLATSALVASYSGNYELLFTDGMYTCSIVALLNCSYIGGSRNWYQFHIERRSPLNNYTAHHASGNPFWTSNMHVDKYGNSKIPKGQDFCLKTNLMHFMTNAARNQNPNNTPFEGDGTLPQWPKWNQETKRHLLIKHCPADKNIVPFHAHDRCLSKWFNPFSLIV